MTRMENRMRKLSGPLCLLAVLIIMAAPAVRAAEAVIGKPAPAFTLPDTNGISHSLSDYRGRPVVLEWTNHECPFVRKHYDTGNMQRLQKQATGNGVIWLSIVSSAPGTQGYTTPAEAREIMKRDGSMATARLFDPDGTVGMAYGAKTTPHMFVIDPEGTLVYMGAIDDNPSPRHDTVSDANNYVEAALKAVREGRMPETTQTHPYGCAVKYRM